MTAVTVTTIVFTKGKRLKLPASEVHRLSMSDSNGLTIASSTATRSGRAGPLLGKLRTAMEGSRGAAVRFPPLPLDLWGHGNQGRWHGTGPLGLAEAAAAIREVCPDGPPSI